MYIFGFAALFMVKELKKMSLENKNHNKKYARHSKLASVSRVFLPSSARENKSKQKIEMYHSFLFFNILICLYLEFYNTVNIDNKRFPLSRISATWHQVPHKRICIIVQEIVKNTDTVSSQVNEVIFQYL